MVTSIALVFFMIIVLWELRKIQKQKFTDNVFLKTVLKDMLKLYFDIRIQKKVLYSNH